ncbi:four helix bundle protein [Humisphaera borealis]|uniref:Four helix bundle protein n=1 Tax=Humisphaera borealis TaxID=2807512 RepID=A0A7M2WRX1_9BACT|nr:four helix bundle protein [Humisphaera borealis]QOV87350.1 four helix bundle protein [Humisphaera borealis]
MTYERFEDTPAWQAAITLAHRVFDLVDDLAFMGQGDLRNQLQRSSLSISNNIAEGFERGSTNELIQYLYIAKGSAGETRSGLRFAEGRPKMRHLHSDISATIQLSESVARQLRGWANSLQNSDIAGQRRMTEQSQAEYRQKERTAKFMEKLNDIRNGRSSASASET